MMRTDNIKSKTGTNIALLSKDVLLQTSASSDVELNGRTPMPTLYPTFHPMLASLTSHRTLMWLCYPVAIAGHYPRSLSFGTGFFKLQLQYFIHWFTLSSVVSYWSCNLKKIFTGMIDQLICFRTPMTMLLSPLYLQHRHLAAHRCFLPSSSKCWKMYADPTL